MPGVLPKSTGSARSWLLGDFLDAASSAASNQVSLRPDPAALGNMKAKYLPNSQFTQLPWDYLHPNHAGYNAMGLAIDIAPFAPAHH